MQHNGRTDQGDIQGKGRQGEHRSKSHRPNHLRRSLPSADSSSRILQNEAAFVTFVTAGFPTKHDTVDILLALEAGGADVIELGVPFSDPQADGPSIQRSNEVSLPYSRDDQDWGSSRPSHIEPSTPILDRIGTRRRLQDMSWLCQRSSQSRPQGSRHLHGLLQPSTRTWRREGGCRRKEGRRKWIHRS